MAAFGWDSTLSANRPALTVREFLAALAGIAVLPSSLTGGQTVSQGSSDREGSDPVSDSARLEIGPATIEITFGPGGFDLPRESLVAWISKAAHAVAHYYGVFPVPLSRIRVNSSERQSGVFGGETWGSTPPFTRIFVGRKTSLQQLDRDWVMTHELIHTAFPDVADEHHWIEEGIATYVEPIARAQIGDLSAQKIWSDMFRDMSKGEPQAFDEGLDRTHTWGRTYWGGALFCLVADLRIRQASGNRKGLQDALRGIRDAGGTIERRWPVTRAFEVGDRASQTNVLTTLYSEMKDKPVYIDLSRIWRKLGVASSDGVVSLSDAAPLARIRRSITSP
jgi:hypothetical protein